MSSQRSSAGDTPGLGDGAEGVRRISWLLGVLLIAAAMASIVVYVFGNGGSVFIRGYMTGLCLISGLWFVYWNQRPVRRRGDGDAEVDGET